MKQTLRKFKYFRVFHFVACKFKISKAIEISGRRRWLDSLLE